MSAPVILTTRQRGEATKAGPWVMVEAMCTNLTGRLLREDHVNGTIYLAVRWKGQGVAIYQVLDTTPRPRGGDRFGCRLIMGGL